MNESENPIHMLALDIQQLSQRLSVVEANQNAAMGEGVEVCDGAERDALLKEAWGVIANVGRGDWTGQGTEWCGVACRFRKKYDFWVRSQLAPANKPARGGDKEG